MSETWTFLAVAAAAPTMVAASQMQTGHASQASFSPGAVDASDARGLVALDRLESALDGGLRARVADEARGGLRRARAERNFLEGLRPPPPLARSHEEELVFFNHLVLGLAEFLDAEDEPAARDRLRSVIRRGRAHRERGRALRPAAP